MNMNSNPQSDIEQTLGMQTFSGKKSILKRFLLWGVPAIVVVIVIILLSTLNGAANLQYKTSRAVLGDLTITVSATGNLEPTNQVDVSSELSGIIKTVDVDYNDQVKVNQVLARLDTGKLQADVKKSRAALQAARAQVLQTQATLNKTQAELGRLRHAHELSGGKVPSAYDLESAEAAFSKAQADVAGARAQVTQAQAELESTQTDMSKALIRSPINGIVLSRDVEPGQTVAASLSAPVLFTLAEDLTLMELHVGVDEADVGQVRHGQVAEFTVDAYPGRVFPARITQVRYGAQDTDGVVTYETVLEVDNAGLLLRPGMTATADITVDGIKQGVLVPNAALRFSPPAIHTDSSDTTNKKSSMMSKLMPRPPRPGKKGSSNQGSDTEKNGRQQVWTLQDGNLVPIIVTTGVTDGIRTEITGGDIEPGSELVVGTMSVTQ